MIEDKKEADRICANNVLFDPEFEAIQRDKAGPDSRIDDDSLEIPWFLRKQAD